MPSIDAHVFVTSKGADTLVEEAARVVSLSRVVWSVEKGGLSEAAARYAKTPSPALIMVEASGDFDTELVTLHRLAEVCSTQTRVILLRQGKPDEDAVLQYRKLEEIGVSDLIILPCSSRRFAQAVIDVFASDAKPKLGRSTAFVGAGGATGSSTVAQNCGYAMASILGQATLLADLDPQYGTLRTNFNLEASFDLLNLEDMETRVDYRVMHRMAEEVSENLRLLTLTPNLRHDPEISFRVVNAIIEIVYHERVHVVCDLPDSWGQTKRDLLQRVDNIVIVAEPTITSLRDAHNVLLELAELEIPTSRVVSVINHMGMPGRIEVDKTDIEREFGHTRLFTLHHDAALFSKSEVEGRMALQVDERRPASREIKALAALLNGDEAATDRRSTLGRLKRALSKWW